MKYKGIIFDLDGTLIDTLEDLSSAMNAAMRQLCLPEHSPQVCRRMIGDGIQTFALRAVGLDHEFLADRAVELMRAEYQRNLVVHSRVYEGLSEVIDRLRIAGVRMGVITNKHQKEAELIIRHFFGDRMEVVVGVSETTPVKPDPIGTQRVLTCLGLHAVETLYVGDSDVDIETARRAGMPFLGVGWGFRGRKALAKAGAADIIDHPGELWTFVA
ncbi:MAG: HAD family hydrolase [Phycisphaerae bacterium]|nr:HAD family hydrolase [Phycisphaerae bacterium]